MGPSPAGSFQVIGRGHDHKDVFQFRKAILKFYYMKGFPRSLINFVNFSHLNLPVQHQALAQSPVL